MRPLFLVLLLLAAPTTRATEKLFIAGAANLVYALDALNTEFKNTERDVVVTTATGASGNLVAQIKNGAPYDLFLSADLDYPEALIKTGDADAKSLTLFAIGRLVLWTTNPDLDLTDIAAAIRKPIVRKLAIANIDTAPYGRATQQALEKLGVWDAAQPKLVVGENISQTTQFIETGNADAGFVALSVVLSPALKNKGHWIEVPAKLHPPLAQGAVLTKRGAANPAAQRYLKFLIGEHAQKILREFGYGSPG